MRVNTTHLMWERQFLLSVIPVNTSYQCETHAWQIPPFHLLLFPFLPSPLSNLAIAVFLFLSFSLSFVFLQLRYFRQLVCEAGRLHFQIEKPSIFFFFLIYRPFSFCCDPHSEVRSKFKPSFVHASLSLAIHSTPLQRPSAALSGAYL